MDYSTTDFSQPWPRADRIFLVEDRKVYVNETVLTMASPVFSAMFTGDFQEKTMKEIPLPDKNYDAFIKLMEMVHPPHRELTRSNVYDIAPLVQEYKMPLWFKQCVEFVLSREKPFVLGDLKMASDCNLSEVRRATLIYGLGCPQDRWYSDDSDEMKSMAPYVPDNKTLIDILGLKVEMFDTLLNQMDEKDITEWLEEKEGELDE